MMSFHSPRETFDHQLHMLLDEVLVLGDMAEQAVTASVYALMQRDLDAARYIFANDQKINDKRYTIENKVIVLMATQQPMARDLRLLAAILEVITELERIADYAKGISKINLLIGNEVIVKPAPEIPSMAELGANMLHRSLLAFVNRDAEAARQIPVEDDAVDALYNKVYREMLEVMIANPAAIDQANYQIWAAHNLERMADRVTNICERIIFIATGEIMEMDQHLGVEDERER